MAERQPTNVIRLDPERLRTGFFWRDAGVQFPPVYRLQGRYWTMNGDGSLGPPGDEAEIVYTLSPTETAGLAEPRWTHIRALDPSTDSGWVWVRHHRSLDLALGYLDAYMDLTDWPEAGGRTLYQTDSGIFTLIQRPARPTTPDCLLIYGAQCPAGPGAQALGLMWDYRDYVVGPGGAALDPNVINPVEEPEA